MVLQKTLFKIWGILTLVLLLLNLVSFFWSVWTKFFLTVSLANLVLFVLAFITRNQLYKLLDRAFVFANQFDHKVSVHRFDSEAQIARIAGIVFIALLIVIGVYLCFVATTDVNKYYWYIHEDNIVESASAVSWFLTVVVLLSSLIRYAINRHFYAITLILYGGLALFAFLCGGEEISWGQRILNFDTPDVLKHINVQSETNLHDIGSISVFSNAFFLITVVFFLVIPYLAGKYFKHKPYLRYFLPIANLQTVLVFGVTLIAWVYVGLRFGTLGFHPFSFYAEHYYNQMDDEIFEFMAAYSFLCFSVTDRLKSLKQTERETEEVYADPG